MSCNKMNMKFEIIQSHENWSFLTNDKTCFSFVRNCREMSRRINGAEDFSHVIRCRAHAFVPAEHAIAFVCARQVRPIVGALRRVCAFEANSRKNNEHKEHFRLTRSRPVANACYMKVSRYSSTFWLGLEMIALVRTWTAATNKTIHFIQHCKV